MNLFLSLLVGEILYSLPFIQKLACSGHKVLLLKLLCFPLSSFIKTLKFAKAKAFPFSFWISWKKSLLKRQRNLIFFQQAFSIVMFLVPVGILMTLTYEF